jgi:CelD/BcsL family acetyltransferase involved in cellulose biosynthesis
MTGRGLSIATIRDTPTLEALAPAWDALFEAASASPFQSPAWLLPWVKAFAAETVCAFAAFEGGALVGLCPFFVHRDPEGGARQLTLAGNGLSDHLDLIAAPGRREDVADALGAWLMDTAAWDRLDFRDVPAGSPLLTLPLPVARERIEPEEPCPVTALPARAEAVVALLDKKRRYDLRRGVRTLGDRGEASFEVARDEPARAAVLASLVDLHQRRWALRGEAGVFADPAVVDFHAAATRALLAAGLLRLHALKLDGRTIAAHYALAAGPRAYSYLHAFDPEFAACNPGAVLTAHVLEAAVRDGATAFDFLRGREPYKYRWRAVDQPKHRRRGWK